MVLVGGSLFRYGRLLHEAEAMKIPKLILVLFAGLILHKIKRGLGFGPGSEA